MASVLMNTVSSSISETAISTTVLADDTLTKASLEVAIEVGDVFKLTSITEPAIDGVYTCIASAAGEISVYPPTGTLQDISDIVATATDIQTNGASPIEGYTIRKVAENNGVPYYWYYRGCAINTMNFNFATGSILNGSIGVIGLSEETRTTVLPSEQTDVAVPPYSIMNSVTSVGVIRIEGVTLGLCSFSSLDLTIDNQINAAKSIGNLGACDLAAYSLMVTGNSEVYFNNLDLYNKFVNSESFSVTIIVTDSDGNSIGIDIPKCKFESLDTPISGKDAFLMQSGSFKGLRDDTRDYMVKISRVDA
jgi:hypothetical protein